MPADGRGRSRAKGIACLIASAFGFAVMAFCVRWCDDFGDALSCFQKSFFRNALAWLIAATAFGRVRRGAPLLGDAPRGRTWALLAVRCIAGTVGIFANFYALSRIPIAEGMTLNKTAPFFTVLLSWIFLGERLGRRQLASLVLAFAGALLVIRPGADFCLRADSVWALVGGLGAGLAYAALHALGRHRVNGAFIVLCFSAFSCLASLPLALLDYRPMTAAQILILLGAGTGAALGQFGVTAAYRYAEPRSIAVFDYTNIVFTGLLGLVVLGQVPDPCAMAGFAVILTAAWCMRR